MLIEKILYYRRPIITFLLPALFVLLFREPLLGQENTSDPVHTTNVKWSLKDDVITINYDLKGSADNKYAVTVVMKKDKDDSFLVAPKTVEGDVGDGFFAGNNREIRWYFRNDYPQGITGEGYYFEIQVKVVSTGGGWIIYALGGVALAGGLVALVFTKSGDNPPGPSGVLPLPPGRPH
jgi:hypothetical protein